MKKKFYIFALFLFSLSIFFIFPSFAFENFESTIETKSLSEKEDWYIVLPGKAISPLEKTSYGVALITDQRNLVCVNCFEKKVQVQKKLNYKPVFLSVGVSDFLILVDDKNFFHIYTPYGKEICTKKIPFSPTEKPALGVDGSLFFRNGNQIFCCDFKGEKRFLVSCQNQKTNFSIKVLDDGSFFILTSDSAKIFSPCGTILNEFSFEKKITAISYLDKILYLRFDDGTFMSYFSKMAHFIAQNQFPLQQQKSLTALIATGFNENQIDRVEKNATEQQISDKNSISQYICFTESSICVVPSSDVLQVFYEYYFNEFVQTSLCASFLMVAKEDWTLKAYKIKLPQSFSGNSISKDNKTCEDRKTKMYSPHYQIFFSSQEQKETMKSLSELLKIAKEDKEKFLCNTNYMNMMQEYYEKLHKEYNQSYELLDRDKFLETCENAYTFMEICKITDIAYYPILFCDVIEKDKNSLHVAKAFECASSIGYDDGKIMKSAEKIIHNSKYASDELICAKLCTFILENCSLMGEKATMENAKKILSYMLTTQTNENVKKNARSTIEKLIANKN